jgi:hypothetical protein
MPIALVIVLLQITMIVHAAKTGRFTPWGWIILFIPLAGAIAYIAIELVPEWLGSAKGQKTQRRLVQTIDPERRYRELSDRLDVTDTLANRVALAEECLRIGRFDEAKHHYDNVLTRPLGDEPHFMLGRARAEFGLGEPEKVIATLDELRRRWPDYQSPDGHLLYARALHGANRHEEALAEFEAVSNYYPGAEARVHWDMLLDALGRREQAKVLFRDTLTQLKRAPSHARQMQAEWIAVAERELRRP